jgi:hypothetical protein
MTQEVKQNMLNKINKEIISEFRYIIYGNQIMCSTISYKNICAKDTCLNVRSSNWAQLGSKQWYFITSFKYF